MIYLFHLAGRTMLREVTSIGPPPVEPKADNSINYQVKYSVLPEELRVDRAQLLTLTAPEMTVLLRHACIEYQIITGLSTVFSPRGRNAQ